MLFTTSAFVMRVVAPYVTNIIDITPPSSPEAYMQEISHAGHTGLYHVRHFITIPRILEIIKKKHIDEAMKPYCRSEDTCQRKLLLDYFGFSRLVFNKRTVAAHTMKSSKQLKRIYPKLLKARLDFHLTITVPSLKC